MNSLTTEFSTSIACGHFPACSGCALQTDVLHPPVWEELDAFFLSKHIHAPLVHGEILQWRCRAKLAVRGTVHNPQIGLFKRGTHEVVSIPTCPLHHPQINRAIAILRQSITQHEILPYQENTHTGTLRYCQLVVERLSNRVELSLVINAEEISACLEKLIETLRRNPLFHSIWVNFQPSLTNRIFGDRWSLCWGEPLVWETLGGISVCFHPACFSQAHLSLFDSMLSSIQKHILPEKNVVEFYAGVGVIGLSIAAKSARLVCSEINPHAKDCFHAALRKLPIDIQRKTSFVLSSAKESTDHLKDAQVLIVDPPRKGLDPELMQGILSSPSLQQIIYVSCGPYSFMRDTKKLLDAGWHVEHAEGYLLFPGSNHVEVLAILQK